MSHVSCVMSGQDYVWLLVYWFMICIDIGSPVIYDIELVRLVRSSQVKPSRVGSGRVASNQHIKCGSQ